MTSPCPGSELLEGRYFTRHTQVTFEKNQALLCEVVVKHLLAAVEEDLSNLPSVKLILGSILKLVNKLNHYKVLSKEEFCS